MELHNIKELIQKYDAGETNLEEEISLKSYFSSKTAADDFEEYKSIFSYYEKQKNQKSTKNIVLPMNKRWKYTFFGIAASIVVLLSISLYYWNRNSEIDDLGTFKTPEEAFVETHKALNLVSKNINSGMKNVQYLEEYDKTKKTIFK